MRYYHGKHKKGDTMKQVIIKSMSELPVDAGIVHRAIKKNDQWIVTYSPKKD